MDESTWNEIEFFTKAGDELLLRRDVSTRNVTLNMDNLVAVDTNPSGLPIYDGGKHAEGMPMG
jgi:hypothetical protein